MAYTLREFCADLTATLSNEGEAGLPKLADKLAALLRNPDFVAATFSEGDPPGKRELWRDPVTDAYLLAHVHQAGRAGAPHNHGESWAIYGTARGCTGMSEWRRADARDASGVVLERTAAYDLGPGEARAYGRGTIHSITHAEKTWVVRVTGGDLDSRPRYRFDPATDTIRETA